MSDAGPTSAPAAQRTESKPEQPTAAPSTGSGGTGSQSAWAAVRASSGYAAQVQLLSPGAGLFNAGDPGGGDGLPGSVQRSGAGGADAAAAGQVQAVAAQGVAGSGASLPYLDRIQQSFGHHDVSQVQAHTGSAAQSAAGALGARGYATGDHVALADTSLHTAAHEAAHTLQQKRGVQLKGGVGAVGDAYERHADAVADAVVQGRSAEALLDAMPTSAAGGASGAVQRKEAPDAPKLDMNQEVVAARRAHGAEIPQIEKCLKGKTSDADLHEVLAICSHWDSTTITAVWQSAELRGQWYDDVVDNLSVSHFKQHPREILAFCQAKDEATRVQIACKAADDCDASEALVALWFLQGVGPSGLAIFKKYDDGDAYEDMYEETEVLAWAKPLLQNCGDAKLERQLRTEELKRRGDSIAENDAMKLAGMEGHYQAIVKRLKGKTYDEDAREVLRIFGKVKAEGGNAGLGAMVRRLEPDGWMEDFVENIPEDFAYSKANVGLFMQVLSHRPPETAIQHAITLISYGLFDWAVTDAEAMLAYHLIKALPPSAQQVFRSRDQNKWFARMEANLEDDVIKGKKGDTEGGYGLVDGRRTDPAGPSKKRADEKDGLLVETQKEQFAAVEAALKAVKDAKSALAALDLLYDTDQGKDICAAFARTLDGKGLIDPMFSWLGDQAFAGDAAKKAGAILAAVSPDQDIVAKQKAERKRDTEIVQAEESKLDKLAKDIDEAEAEGAPALLKALAEQGDDHVRAYTRYLDRRGLIVTLLDTLGTARWDKGNVTYTLRVLRFRDPVHNLIYAREMLTQTFSVNGVDAHMAYDVIKALPPDVRKEFATFEPEWLKALDDNLSVELRESKDFGFYDGKASGDQTALLVKLLDSGLWQPASFGHLRMVMLMLAQAGPDTLKKAEKQVTEHWDALGAADEAERAAVKKAADDKKGETAPPCAERLAFFGSLGFSAEGFDPKQVTDKTWGDTTQLIFQGLDAVGDVESGGAGLLGYVMGFRDSADVKGLRSDELQQAFGGHIAGIRFGKSGRVEEGDKEKENEQDVGEIDFEVDEERGLLKLDAGMLPIAALSIMSGTTVVKSGPGALEKVHIYIKYATDVDAETKIDLSLGSLVVNDLRVVTEDRQFGVASLVAKDFAIHGIRDNAPQVNAGDNWLEDAGKWAARFLEYLPLTLPALIGRGYTRDFGALVENIKKALADEMNARVQLGSLVANDIVDSRGGHIGKVEVGNIDLDFILSLDAWLKQADAEIATLEGKKKEDRTGVEAHRLEALKERTTYFRGRKALRDKLDAELKAGKLGEEDKKKKEAELEALNAELKGLNVRGGIAKLDFGKDIDFAGFKAADLNVSDIRIEGSIAGGQEVVSAALGGKESLRADASLAGKSSGPAVDAKHSGIKVTAGKITGHDVSYTSQTRRDVQLQVAIAPLAAKESAGTITEAERVELSGMRKELAQVEKAVEELAGLEDAFATLDDVQRQRYQLLVEYLKQPPSIEIASMDLTNAGIGADMSRGDVFVHAGDATLTGVQVGDTHVGTVTGKDLRVGGSAGGGGKVSLDATKVVLDGVEKQGRYAHVLAQLKELAAKKEAGGFTTADAAAEMRLNELKAIHDKLEREVKGEKETLDGLDKQIAELRAKRDKLPKVPKEPRDAIDEEIRPLLTQAHPMLRRREEYQGWHGTASVKKVTVDEAHVDVNNVGDFLADGFTPKANNLEISGRGDKDGAMVGNVVVEDASFGSDLEPDKKSTIDKLDLKNLKGKVKVIDEDHVELDKFGLDDLTIDVIDLQAGDSRYQVTKNAILKGLTISAQLSWKQEKDEAGGNHRVFDNLTVSHAHLDRIEGNGICLTLPDKSITIEKGALVGIDVTHFDLASKTVGALDVQSASITDLRYAAGKDVSASIGSLSSGKIGLSSVEAGKLKLSVADLKGSAIKYDQPGMGITVKELAKGNIKDLEYDANTGKVAFPSIEIGTLDFERIAYEGGGKHLNVRKQLRGEGIILQGTLDLKTDQEKGKDSLQALHIDLLKIPKATFAALQYVDDNKLMEVNVDSGSILGTGVELRNFDLGTGAMDLKLGATDLKGLDFKQQEWVEGPGGKKVLQQALHLAGNVKADSLGLGILAKGGMKLDFDNMTSDELRLEVGKAGGNAVTLALGMMEHQKKGAPEDEKKGLSGSVKVDGQVVELDLNIGTLELGNLNWSSGDHHLSSNGNAAVVKALKVKAKVERFATEAEAKAAGSSIKSAKVESLVTGKIESPDLVYQDKKAGRIVRVNPENKKALEIAKVELTNFTWTPDKGVGEGSKVGVHGLDTGKMQLDFGKQLSGSLGVTAQSIGVEWTKDGQKIDLTKLGVEFDGDAGGHSVDAKVKDLSTSDPAKPGQSGITINPDQVLIPALKIGTVRLDQLQVNSPAMELGVPSYGFLQLDNLTADIVIDRYKGPPDKSAPPFQRLTVKKLDVPTGSTKHLYLELKDMGIKVKVNGDGTFKGLSMKDFSIAAPAGGKGDWVRTGSLGLELFDTKALEATVGGKDFFAGLAVNDLKLYEMGAAGRNIDITSLTVSNLKDAEKKYHPSGNGLEITKTVMHDLNVRQRGDQTKVGLGALEVSGVTYKTGDLTLKINKAIIPKSEDPNDDSMQRLADGTIRAKQLNIFDADVDLDLSSGGGGGGGGQVDLRFLDHINGTVELKLIGENNMEFKGGNALKIVNGHIKLQQIEDALAFIKGWAVGFRVDGDGNLEMDAPGVDPTVWRIDSETERKNAKNDWGKLSTMADSSKVIKSPPSSGKPMAEKIEDIKANLNITNAPMKIGDSGQVLIEEAGVSATGSTATSVKLGVSDAKINLKGFKLGGLGEMKNCDIYIKEMKKADNKLTFKKGGVTPKHLKLGLDAAVATNIRIGPEAQKK